MKRIVIVLLSIMFISSVVVSCGGEDAAQDEQEIAVDTPQEVPGELRININGEDFVRSGFVSSDGWYITFRHLYITVAEIAAYQTDPPYDPHSGEGIIGEVKVELYGVFTMDLAEGDENAEPILVGTIADVPAGHYNAMSWSLIPAIDGSSNGYSIYIDAQAEKGDQSYNVHLGFDKIYRYTAGEYIGDVRKGFVTAGGSDELEMTFHFDHIFGDIEQPADCELNMMAVGFEPFAELMQEGTVEEDMKSLSVKLAEETYAELLEIIPTLGHTGEGHCHCTVID